MVLEPGELMMARAVSASRSFKISQLFILDTPIITANGMITVGPAPQGVYV